MQTRARPSSQVRLVSRVVSCRVMIAQKDLLTLILILNLTLTRTLTLTQTLTLNPALTRS
jgi:hypothetical protein